MGDHEAPLSMLRLGAELEFSYEYQRRISREALSCNREEVRREDVVLV